MRHMWIVFKKELLDIFRDRRSLILGLMLPIVLYPVMFSILGGTMEGIQKDATEAVAVGVFCESGDIKMSQLTNPHTADTIFSVMPDARIVEFIGAEDAYNALSDGEIMIAVGSNWAGATLSSQAYSPVQLRIIYDENKMASQSAGQNLSALLNAYNQAAANQKLLEMGIDITTLHPAQIGQMTLNDLAIEVTGEPVTSGSGGMMLSMLVPMMLVVTLASAGLAVAVDQFAGEKDRKTFEPLLTTKAGAFPIMMGKYCAVNVMALVTMIMMVLGMVVGYILNPAMLTFGVEDGPALVLPTAAIVLVVVQVLLLALTFSGIQTAISTWSRSSKEASSYGAFLTIGSMLPAMATMYLQAGDIKQWMMFVPVLNVIGSLKMILAGMIRYDLILMSVGAGAVFLAAVLWFTVSLFRKEEVMFRA